jgi:hypothetical protein
LGCATEPRFRRRLADYDPASFPGAVNRYTYAANNLLRYEDPDGTGIIGYLNHVTDIIEERNDRTFAPQAEQDQYHRHS